MGSLTLGVFTHEGLSAEIRSMGNSDGKMARHVILRKGFTVEIDLRSTLRNSLSGKVQKKK